MAHFGHVIGVEPFEEATQGDSESTATSPDALQAFYAKMEQQDVLQRTMSRTQSTPKRSLWSRRSTKKQLGAPVNNVPALGKLTSAMDSDQSEENKVDDEKDDKSDQVVSLLSRSIIPDALSEAPAWFIKENDLAIGQTTSYRIKYPIHSPFGPRFYKNQHLIPSSQLRAAARPPSVFSPSFPPMAASMHDHSEDSTSRPGLSRTPSGSPLGTPNSSQADVAAKPRSRKTSQTTPDTVDLLDVTDPWGTHYHHQSPYDPGLTSSSGHISPVEADSTQESPMSPRSRRSSMTAGQTRRKIVTPSPLSQSTSALHTQIPEIAPHVTRKLSKRRKPLVGSLFGGQNKDTDESKSQAAAAPHAASAPPLHVESAPVTPTDAHVQSSTMSAGIHSGGKLPKRHSTVPLPLSSVATHHLGDKKEKRGSVLGRLAKKLSIMKRPAQELVRGSAGSTDDWQHIGMGDAHSDRNSRRSAVIQRDSLQERPSTEQRKTDPIKRIPPPVEPLTSAPDAPPPRQSEDHKSILSVETPLAMGKLTIANPDVPSSADNTPARASVSLPADPEPVPELVDRPRASFDPVERPKSALPPLPDANQDHDSQQTATPVMPPTATAELPPTTPWCPPPGDVPQSPATTDPMTLYPTYVNGLSRPTSIPFPIADQRPPSSISTSARATMASSPVSFMDDSPLSRASMIVNPPTPHNPPVPMKPTPVIPPSVSAPTIQTAMLERTSRNLSPTKIEAPKPATKPKAEVEVKADTQRGTAPVTSRKAETSKVEAPKPRVDVTKPKAGVEVRDEPQRGTTPAPSRRTETSKVEAPKPRADVTKPKTEVEVRDEPQRGTTPAPSRRTETSKVEAPKPRADVTKPKAEVEVRDEPQRGTAPATSRRTEISKVEAPRPRVDVTKPKNEGEVRDDPQRGTTPVTSRKTETFKLIRTASGNVLPANETITAGGEQWEVVESSDSSKKNKTKERSSRSKDRENGGRKEHRRQGQSAPQEIEADQRRVRQRSLHGKEVDQTLVVPTPSKSARSHSMDIPRPNQDGSKHDRKEPKLNLDKPQPAPPPPTPGPSRVDRQPSLSTRPTSELPSTAELNALRAREAWDMDRLWKGKSMYYGEPEPNGSVAAPPQTRETRTFVPSVNTDLTRDNGTVRSSGHGSSHTSFMVQPFQGQPPANIFYSNMPSAPPPTIYSPTSFQQTPSSVSYDYHQSYRSLPPFALPPPDPLPNTSSRPNPLPPPPRESSYRPSTLPPLSDPGGRPNSDHWIKHPGVTTAH